ncbi:MAG: hypothetical protein Q9222_002741 [Ikaeria aurantiellina]
MNFTETDTARKHTCAVIFGWSSAEKSAFPVVLDPSTSWLEGANKEWVAFDSPTGIVKLHTNPYPISAADTEPNIHCLGYRPDREPFRSFKRHRLTPEDQDEDVVWTQDGFFYRAWRRSTRDYDDTVVPNLVVATGGQLKTIWEYIESQRQRTHHEIRSDRTAQRNIIPARNHGQSHDQSLGYSIPRLGQITKPVSYIPDRPTGSSAMQPNDHTVKSVNDLNMYQRDPLLESNYTGPVPKVPALPTPNEDPLTSWQGHQYSPLHPNEHLRFDRRNDMKASTQVQGFPSKARDSKMSDFRSTSSRGQIKHDGSHKEVRWSSSNQQIPKAKAFSRPRQIHPEQNIGHRLEDFGAGLPSVPQRRRAIRDFDENVGQMRMRAKHVQGSDGGETSQEEDMVSRERRMRRRIVEPDEE